MMSRSSRELIAILTSTTEQSWGYRNCDEKSNNKANQPQNNSFNEEAYFFGVFDATFANGTKKKTHTSWMKDDK